MQKPNTLQELLSSEDKWTQGYYARDKHSNPCQEHEKRATCFCLMGGVYHVSPFGSLDFWPTVHTKNDKLRLAISKLYPERATFAYGMVSIVAFNDDPRTTFQDIRRVIEEANV